MPEHSMHMKTPKFTVNGKRQRLERTGSVLKWKSVTRIGKRIKALSKQHTAGPLRILPVAINARFVRSLQELGKHGARLLRGDIRHGHGSREDKPGIDPESASFQQSFEKTSFISKWLFQLFCHFPVLFFCFFFLPESKNFRKV